MTIQELESEFSSALINSHEYRQKQRDMVEYYNSNVFYQRRDGDPKYRNEYGVNLLKAFADKNIHYTSPFPKIKKLPSGTDMESRMRASQNEKIVLGTWDNNKGKYKQRKWATDGTLMAEAYAMTEWDFKTSEVKIKRLDPRYCYPIFSSEVEGTLTKFFYAVPMTKEQVKAQYNVDPTTSGIETNAATIDGNDITVDGRDRFFVVIYLDSSIRAAFVGEHWIEEPHKHRAGTIPVDVAAPFETGKTDNRGGFFLEPLLVPQAEINETLRKKANIIRKLSNPAVWGRGIVASQADEIKKAMAGDTGGFIGLKASGELGILQLPETKLLNEHILEEVQRMKDISGFPTATFGESVGANTSGDALSMYFQPTTQATRNQWVAWIQFYESINEKILRFYEVYGVTGKPYKISGKRLKGSYEVVPTQKEDGQIEYSRQFQTGGYGVEFTKDMIGNDYCTVVIAPSATPKDEFREKQLAMESVANGFLPRVVAYEMWEDIVDPEDVLDLLAQEREDPRLNPDLLNAAAGQLGNMQGQPQPGQPMPGEMPTPTGL